MNCTVPESRPNEVIVGKALTLIVGGDSKVGQDWQSRGSNPRRVQESAGVAKFSGGDRANWVIRVIQDER